MCSPYSCNNNQYISANYLAQLHGISIDEADLLCQFAKSLTIRYKECYGDGGTIFPLWLNEIQKANAAISKLCGTNR